MSNRNSLLRLALLAATILPPICAAIPGYGDLPLVFEANRGQVPAASVDFLARGPGYAVALQPASARLAVRVSSDRRASLNLRLLGAADDAAVRPESPLATKINYLIGNDPQDWQSGIETFARVRYEGVYPGIDVVYYGNQRRLEYDFVVAPGADPGSIGFRFDGADRVRLEAGGSLAIEVDGATLRLEPPVIYQGSNDSRMLVAGGYTVDAEQHVRFEIGDYDRSKPLIVDPLLVYSTFLGGSDFDRLTSIAVDGDGNAYITGFTESLDFPTANPAQASHAGGSEDIIVTKLNAEGSQILYSTYIGGTETFRERSNYITVDDTGHAYVACSTNAPDFPTASSAPSGPYQSTASGGDNACYFKLSADGSSLEFSTYLGGNGNDTGNTIAVDAVGDVYLGGFTGSTDLPDTSANPAGPFQAVRKGSSDGYLAKLTADGSSLTYLTYMGGDGGEGLDELHVQADGSVIFAGQTSSANFPVSSPNPAGPLQSALTGVGRDAVLGRLNADGSDLVYATFLGGSGDDVATALAVDDDGNAFLTGITQSADFPTISPSASGPFQTAPGGGLDIFVAKVNPDGSALIYSTYVATAGRDTAFSIAVDGLGNAFLAGDTSSAAFPTQAPTQPAFGASSRDAVAFKLDSEGSSLLFSTFIGGNDFDTSEALALDAAGNIYVVGQTRSGNFALASPDPAGPFQTTIASFSLTGFVTKIQPFDDNEGPKVSSIEAAPSVAEIDSPAAGVLLTAVADDSQTGASAIASAEYSVNGGAFAAMAAADGAFDNPIEDVTALIGPFATPDVYEVCVRATDAVGNVGEDEEDCILLPVYDPNGGFVTGGGSVESPSAADLENGAAGTARFGFVSKYLPGQSTPDGNLQFRFKDGDIRFHSTSMDWLVVTGEPRAMFRGDGELNGETTCKFEVDAWDESLNGEDAFGLKIFACGPGVDRYALDPTPLSNGSIKIHQ